ncbi:UPAR/Ly6 domain-containing protein crim-like [Liolophura sinensis]|uniref:UPAR/Ly6 domain-containing protein crim-like n=1 Tax=Liolophura sinensis TaxID=3198878 RepID=UPI003158A63D
MGWSTTCLVLLGLMALVQEGTGLFCHRCSSSMGGCGENLNLIMFPWRPCGPSEFCVKVVQKHGSGVKIIRECESELIKDTRHRLRMPVLRRHGYCINARKNDPYNPQQTSDPSIQYCFCNDFNGCNTGSQVKVKFLPVAVFCGLLTYFVSKLH